ncbi:SidA/IucD/PvdA family monooxygenase [Nocardioides humilatus]|uniref:SidA/IucD/PvdA family monooxygenase n=1 Tax=Nocardioides humilatus TaxID=2607660 RepID=A0A5B1LM65_9ACTN|nr:NAD(P)/FAD-dependent oxidoreductase [Nocardioides humilatus]KAA1421875.1 SidA/IucD/PvdA family monooxygenase [Nocardioides humilatus]
MSQTINRAVDADIRERGRLAAALEEANIPTLLLVLAHLTGDDKWLAEPYRPQRGPVLDDNDSGSLPIEIQEEIRAAALRVILDQEEGLLSERPLSPDQVTRMLGIALVEDIDEAYGELLAEELGVVSRDVEVPQQRVPGFGVLIIGAGLSGIALAIKLKRTGVPFTILEKNHEIGGTWWENVYPGCGVDTPSHLYSFSFEPNGEWSRFFAKRPEVHRYLARLVDKYGIRDSIRFGHEVLSAEFDDASSTWSVEVADEEGRRTTLTTPVLATGVGMVNRPSIPTVTGAETFAGPIMHTAEWDTDVDYEGKTVAVIGTGASAMQLVPSIAGVAAKVVVFQRSKQWAVPHPNYHRDVPAGVLYLMKRLPLYTRWYRLRAFWNFSDRLHSSLRIDPEWTNPEQSINEQNERHRVFLTKYIKDELGDREDLYEACIPEYPPYGKRPLLDNGWFRTVQRDDVELVTDGVREITPTGVVTDDGTVHEADIVVWATGFKALQFLWPMEIRGRSGASLAEQWGHHDARAHLGVTVPDFPNLFILNGPNTNAGHGGSAILACEFQVRYIMQGIALLAGGEVDQLEVTEQAFWDYNHELDEELDKCIWSHPGMTTWYRNEAGRIVVSSPWTYLDSWNRMRVLDPADYGLGE